jgi:hypothetical protein
MSQNVGAPSDNTLFTRAEQWLLLIVGAVQFVNILDFMMVMPLGPDFAKALDIPSAHLGQIAASYGIAAAVSGFSTAGRRSPSPCSAWSSARPQAASPGTSTRSSGRG